MAKKDVTIQSCWDGTTSPSKGHTGHASPTYCFSLISTRAVLGAHASPTRVMLGGMEVLLVVVMQEAHSYGDSTMGPSKSLAFPTRAIMGDVAVLLVVAMLDPHVDDHGWPCP